jgi:hypothetical protein
MGVMFAGSDHPPSPEFLSVVAMNVLAARLV